METWGKRQLKPNHNNYMTCKHISPWTPTKLLQEEKREALNSLMFLVEKHDGRVKARNVADGSKQRQHPGYKKEIATSPTVSNKGIMITAAIKAHEGRHVKCFDIPRAYLQALSDKEVLMLLKDPLTKLVIMVDPKLYQKNVSYNTKGVSQMYIKLNKALYGLLKSILLFYKKLIVNLKACGFKVNPL